MMRKTLQITALILALLLLTLAVPALGHSVNETTLDSGVIVINESVMATEDTPRKTIDMVEDEYPKVPAPPENYGGSLNIDD